MTERRGRKGGRKLSLSVFKKLRKVLLKDSKKHRKLTHSYHCTHVGFSTPLLVLHVGRHLERREGEPSSGLGISVSEKVTEARLLPRILQKIPFS